MSRIAGKLTIGALLLGAFGMGLLFSYYGMPEEQTSLAQSDTTETVEAPSATPTETLAATATPEPSATPAKTLLPPPTFEPPTVTPTASIVPSPTIVPTTDVNVSIPGLHGAETATPSSTPGCETRADWKLTYTVQFNDTLTSIANLYGVWPEDIAEANCLDDVNVIVEGQVLHVPGDSQPVVSEIECVDWEALTPFNGTQGVPADGSITFNWRGPQSPISLIRIYRPDGTTYERTVELRQNEQIELNEYLSQEGTYTWYVYPLNQYYQQVSCVEGGPWTFYKPLSATATPTMEPTTAPVSNVQPTSAPQVIVVTATPAPATAVPTTVPAEVPAADSTEQAPG
ncbi:LysM peptidoglycan-binding domain-containing protein [Aggregatilinea lenta]|uniref:LysM peptidoglycan-binding domain-containing protein n=1 Tax=Aggregatilinea lenta TaxID=913108 RepID=UPI000E5BE664|nr:LysM peptidoglycan-binding domain-containing protein [Aggregatilinea lenta]